MSLKNDNFFHLFEKYDHISDSYTTKIGNLFISYFIVLGLVFLSILLIKIIDIFIVNLGFESVVGLIHESQVRINKYPFYIVVILGPFFEEIFFRLGLLINKLNISVFLAVFFYKVIGGQFYKFNIYDAYSYIYLGFGVVIFVILYYYIPKSLILSLKTHQKKLVYISIIVFGLVHIFNIHKLYWELVLFYPFFALPQMTMGYFITNLRLKYGFIWGFALHIIINGITTLLN